jgi:hypothetical protein
MKIKSYGEYVPGTLTPLHHATRTSRLLKHRPPLRVTPMEFLESALLIDQVVLAVIIRVPPKDLMWVISLAFKYFPVPIFVAPRPDLVGVWTHAASARFAPHSSEGLWVQAMLRHVRYVINAHSLVHPTHGL